MRFLIICLTTLFAAQAGAQSLIDGRDIYRIQSVLSSMSMPSTLEYLDDGDPVLRAEYEGWNFNVYFYGCVNNQNCDTVQFSSRFNTEGAFRPQQALDWHSEWVHGRVYLARDGDPVIEMPILLFGGVTEANFRENASLWSDVLLDFVDELGWGGSSSSTPSK